MFTLNPLGVPEKLGVWSSTHGATSPVVQRALEIAATCRYEPAQLGGESVSVRDMRQAIRIATGGP